MRELQTPIHAIKIKHMNQLWQVRLPIQGEMSASCPARNAYDVNANYFRFLLPLPLCSSARASGCVSAPAGTNMTSPHSPLSSCSIRTCNQGGDR